MQRLVLLFHDPHHLDADEARAWLRREIAGVLQADGVLRATLTRLGEASPRSCGGFDWLLEFDVEPGQTLRGPLGEIVADLRLLGMSPMVAVADDRNAVELKSP